MQLSLTIFRRKNSINIRLDKETEHKEVENLVREAFWNVYRPGCFEHYVLHILRKCEDFVSELNFVMEKDGKIIGQTVFVKAKIVADNGTIIPIITMGPICIANKYKRQGYGKILLDSALEKVKVLGFGAICFEGNIDFYGKSGFTYASNFGIRYHGLPKNEDASFFLCKELVSGYLDDITGKYITPSAYFVDADDVEEFDKQFPYKEKLRLPTQIL